MFCVRLVRVLKSESIRSLKIYPAILYTNKKQPSHVTLHRITPHKLQHYPQITRTTRLGPPPLSTQCHLLKLLPHVQQPVRPRHVPTKKMPPTLHTDLRPQVELEKEETVGVKPMLRNWRVVPPTAMVKQPKTSNPKMVLFGYLLLVLDRAIGSEKIK